MDSAAWKRLAPLAAVAGLLVAAIVTAALATPQIHSVPPAPVPTHSDKPLDQAHASLPPEQPLPSLGQVQHPVSMPAWLTNAIGLLLIILAVGVVAVLAWMALSGRFVGRVGQLPPGAPQDTTDEREDVLAAVAAGLADLDDDGDPRRAVIACWVRLESAAAAAGTPREPGDSPTDLVLRLLSSHDVSASALVSLADVYRLARYATHDVDTGMRDQARSALRRLQAELTGLASAP